LCDPQWKRCTRYPQSIGDTRSTSMSEPEPKHDSGSVMVSETKRSDAGQPTSTDAGSDSATERDSSLPSDAEQEVGDAATQRAAGGSEASETAGAAGHATAGASGMAGARAEAGSEAPVDREQTSADCLQDAYCYGFEAGALDPSGALWPSPSDGSGGLPPNQELTIATYPAASQNAMLVSRPSAKDGWPKATVGFSGPRTPFSTLTASFDYVAGDTLVKPNPRVILFRFVGWPERSGDSVNVGLFAGDVMLEVQMNGPELLESLGAASAPGVLTHVVATFTRGQSSCMVEIAYGALQPKAAAFPCEVQTWQIELGLDMLETPPDRYTYDYFAYFDNLRVSTSP
jgi:hypothetical protein